MHDKPPRRWFRFSLRTMFIVVTALCCWLAWECRVVRQRQALLREIRGNFIFQVTTADARTVHLPPGAPAPPAARIPLLRKWLGDEAIQEISYARGFSDPSQADLARIARIFPEAKLREHELALEPCHPGCFPHGTLVDTPHGQRAIDTIRPGDALTAILPNGQTVMASVQSVFVATNRLWKIETQEGGLVTTQTQPLCLAVDRTVRAGDLQPGDRILRRTGEAIHSVKVLAVIPTDRTEKVFNLVLGDSEVFVAAGFLARSKPPAK